MWLEQQFADINRNINILMDAFNNRMGIFEEYGGSNAVDKSEQGSKYWGEKKNHSKKEPKKDQPILSHVNQSLFKIEEKIILKLYHGEIDALKFNHWLQQMEFYFSVHQIEEGHKISFV